MAAYLPIRVRDMEYAPLDNEISEINGILRVTQSIVAPRLQAGDILDLFAGSLMNHGIIDETNWIKFSRKRFSPNGYSELRIGFPQERSHQDEQNQPEHFNFFARGQEGIAELEGLLFTSKRLYRSRFRERAQFQVTIDGTGPRNRILSLYQGLRHGSFQLVTSRKINQPQLQALNP